MWMAVIAASVATILLYGLSPDVAIHGIIKGATARATIETLVVFYSITFLQRMMEKRKNLSNAQVAMNGLFNNNRVNASIVPFLLGMLPAASTVFICGPIVLTLVCRNRHVSHLISAIYQKLLCLLIPAFLLRWGLQKAVSVQEPLF